jgi:poly(3-hydroxybutyrate) depolymerase
MKHNKQLYPLHEAQRQGLKSYFNALAANLKWQVQMLEASAFFGIVPQPYTQKTRQLLDAAMEMSERFSRDYTKPAFNIAGATEEVILDKDFGSLLHFKQEGSRNVPKVLIVAPMSGHYSTLLRETVAQLLPSHDVYITDWKDAKMVPLAKGDFGLDDYISYVKEFIETVGHDTHVVAVCQPTVATLAAIALLAEEKSEYQPLSMTLMSGPIDTRAAETEVTKLAQGKSIEWFEENMIAQVPDKYPGAGRLVYPGFLQLFSFMAMNPDKHMQSHINLFEHLSSGDHVKADKIKDFYDEYLAVCDLPAKFYLETVQKVFINQDLAKGMLTYRGKKIDLSSIHRTALLTVEGGKDDIAAPGQTFAAHALCSGLKDDQKSHYLQKDAGHFGIFSGHYWRNDICPQVTRFIRKIAARHGFEYEPVTDQASSKPNNPPKFN